MQRASFETTPTAEARGRGRRSSRTRATIAALIVAVLGLVLPLQNEARAEGRGNILRIDPRASQSDGAPVLTTVMEVIQHYPLSRATGPCNAMSKADDVFDCIANEVEKPKALWDAIKWEDGKVYLTIHVEGRDEQLKLIEKKKWGDASKEKVAGVGTAWLILLDSGSSIGGRFDESKAVANAFVNSKRDNDIFKVMYFNDAGVVYTLDWTTDKAKASSFIASTVSRPFPKSGRGVRELGDIIKNAAIDGFRELGNVGQQVKAPMHQAMIVLSSGDGGSGSSSSVGQAGSFIAQYMTKGRFPEDNLALPKMPVPVISVWFPNPAEMEERYEQARAFMSNLANTEIGGFFTVIRDKSMPRGDRIVTAVRARFDSMWIAKWQASCVAPTIQQTFNLAFDPALGLAGDGSYKDVPIGIDPKSWPLDVDTEATVAEAEKNPIEPGGKMTVFGTFCWEGHKDRAELYLLPKNQEVPTTLEGVTFEDAETARKTLIGQGLKATIIDAGRDSVTFELPDSEKFLSGKGETFTARVVLLDNETSRTSAVTKDKIVTVKAVKAPALASWLKSNNAYLVIGGIVFAGVVLILLLVTAFRSGGKRRGGGAIVAAPPPRPGSGGAMAMAGPPMGMAAPPAPPPPPPAMPGPAFVQRATLTGQAGIFTVLPGIEMKAGRDGALCQILLNEPRVSGTHASMKIDGGQLFVRDDNSNNGTTVNGQRLPPGVWTPVTNGAQLRFGPIEFSVGLE